MFILGIGNKLTWTRIFDMDLRSQEWNTTNKVARLMKEVMIRLNVKLGSEK